MGGYGILKQSQDAFNWPQAKGHIISSSLIIDHLPKFIDWSADPLRWYGIRVQYDYTVDGGLYESNRLSFQRGDIRNPKDALKAMNNFRRHREVMVYYDPKNPQEAVLQPGDTADVYIPLMIGGALTLLGLLALYSQSLGFNGGIDRKLTQGQIYQDQGRLEEALWQYNQAISMNPNLILGYSNRGGLYLKNESWEMAIADFNHILTIDPNNAFAYFSLGKAYLAKKAYAKALVNIQKAMELGLNVNPTILEDIKKNL